MADLALNNQSKYPTWVIKIGGSLLGAPELAKWLAVIVQHSHGKVIIVPGGSIFADAVREAQIRSGIEDVDAHHLALKAMDQFGLLMDAMNKALMTVDSESAIAAGALQKRPMVWLPSDMLMAEQTIPNNWDTTSDSLSAWLANQLGAEHLILVKSASLTSYQSNHVMVEQLMNDALVDGGLVDFMAGQLYQTWVMHKGDAGLFNTRFEVKTLEKHGLLIHSNTH
jgi:aspartokinase-like uncharacterized kinase